MKLNHVATHAITGTTGFVGSCLVLELLQRTNSRVVGIVRPNEESTATERLHKVLYQLIEGYALPSSLADEVEYLQCLWWSNEDHCRSAEPQY